MVSASATAFQDGLLHAGWTVTDLWVAAVGIGGGFERRDVERIVYGQQVATPTEHDILAAAFNDYFVDQGQDHPMQYWRDLPTELR
jgi:hypothetical protein